MGIGSVSNNMSMYNSAPRPQVVSEQTQENLLKAADKDGDNALGKDEFVKYSEGMDKVTGYNSGEKAEELFDKLDVNSDGVVSAEELAAGRESKISEMSKQFGADQLTTMDQVNDILSETSQTLLDMVGSNSEAEEAEEDDAFGFLSNEWSAKIQEYMAQQAATLENNAESVENAVNAGTVSQVV